MTNMDRNAAYLRSLRHKALAESVEFFEGDVEAAERWLSTPVRGLGYQTPNDMLSSETGIEQVRTLIGRLEHGIVT
ncbi:MbcA/ParS/Xre antitoxin family protein [Marinobacter sp. LV10R510-11A]|uniref:MbcA/ParS/Xre antitoxin family protein n=1 Tax=Marinobacter sp. LV10R510-11A TaxID=1415568 RepID=UPI001D0D5EBC|nr:MbcA/ParS/Xre antitoxin family protein [Marinobacter sp. LV10R510-11A]